MAVISIFSNMEPSSTELKTLFQKKLEAAGFLVFEEFHQDAELLICVGGDGALLNTLRRLSFPDVPVVGVNTGHLGFFQELQPYELDEFIFRYREKRYEIHRLKTVGASIIMDDDSRGFVVGLNEIVIRGAHSHVTQLNIFIEESFIQTFRGDGVLVTTPSGSTAYNYTLGGCIVDPRLDVLQLTPIGPVNNSAYRSFPTSILLPPDLTLSVYPEYGIKKLILITADGVEKMYGGVKRIQIGFSDQTVNLIRFENYDFWNKVKQKLL